MRFNTSNKTPASNETHYFPIKHPMKERKKERKKERRKKERSALDFNSCLLALISSTVNASVLLNVDMIFADLCI